MNNTLNNIIHSKKFLEFLIDNKVTVEEFKINERYTYTLKGENSRFCLTKLLNLAGHYLACEVLDSVELESEAA